MVGRHEPFDLDRGIGELVAIGLSQLQLVNGQRQRLRSRRLGAAWRGVARARLRPVVRPYNKGVGRRRQVIRTFVCPHVLSHFDPLAPFRTAPGELRRPRRVYFTAPYASRLRSPSPGCGPKVQRQSKCRNSRPPAQAGGNSGPCHLLFFSEEGFSSGESTASPPVLAVPVAGQELQSCRLIVTSLSRMSNACSSFRISTP